ncbi:MAG TPA: BrnT family toxin [Thermoflexales bacterium]|nr:BrnT family toxin [Thermoflexales bacterium]HQW36734.1 BrnT family toxin [Thermoflexales bacterium]HQZ21597.1 BrnT family toxin [Thermoflexales bacterium]HRA00528.1 BrnT family toxin [Thermoflexales bacterium]
MTKFEFDPQKSAANKTKHGIDFVQAQVLWQDETRLEIPARTEDEPRLLIIGKIDERHWSAVITYRGEAIRIISVRRSRPEEIKLYEGEGI